MPKKIDYVVITPPGSRDELLEEEAAAPVEEDAPSRAPRTPGRGNPRPGAAPGPGRPGGFRGAPGRGGPRPGGGFNRGVGGGRGGNGGRGGIGSAGGARPGI